MEKEYEKNHIKINTLKTPLSEMLLFSRKNYSKFHLHPEQSCDKPVKVHRIQLEKFSGKRIMIPDKIRANYCKLF